MRMSAHATAAHNRRAPATRDATAARRVAASDPVAQLFVLQQQIGNQAVVELLRSSGQPLGPDVRGLMEARFGRDFGAVRVHTDEQAGHTAQALGARAVTVGSDIAFGRGRYAPATGEGQRLLAHELAHVVQQTAQPGPHIPAAAAEAEASSAGAQVAGGQAADVRGSAPVSAQRQELSEEERRRVAEAEPCPNCHKRTADRSQDAAAGDFLSVGQPWTPDERAAIEAYVTAMQSEAAPAPAPAPAPASPELDQALREHAEREKHPIVNNVGTRTAPAIANLPIRQREVPTVRFVTTGKSMFDITAEQLELGTIQSTQIGAEPTAGYNFDTYLRNETTGQLIPAKHLDGSRYQVFMGTPECPGCHFGHGLVVDLHGGHFLLATVPILAEGLGSVSESLLASETAAPALEGPALAPVEPAPTPPAQGGFRVIQGGGEGTGIPSGQLRSVPPVGNVEFQAPPVAAEVPVERPLAMTGTDNAAVEVAPTEAAGQAATKDAPTAMAGGRQRGPSPQRGTRPARPASTTPRQPRERALPPPRRESTDYPRRAPTLEEAQGGRVSEAGELNELEEGQTHSNVNDPRESNLQAAAGTAQERPAIQQWRQRLGSGYQELRLPRYVRNRVGRTDMILVNDAEQEILIGDVTAKPGGTSPERYARQDVRPHGIEAGGKTAEYGENLAGYLDDPEGNLSALEQANADPADIERTRAFLQEYQDYTVVVQEMYTDTGGFSSRRVIRVGPRRPQR